MSRVEPWKERRNVGIRSGGGNHEWDLRGMSAEMGWLSSERKSWRHIVLVGPDNNVSFGPKIIALLRSSKFPKGCFQLSTTDCGILGTTVFI